MIPAVDLGPGGGSAAPANRRAFLYTVAADQGKHHQSRHDAGQKELIYPHLGNNPVEDQRQTGRKQQAKTAGCGDEPQGKLFGILILDQGWVQEASQGKNRHAGRPGKGGKDGAHHQGHHCQPARHPTEQQPGEVEHPPGRPACRQQGTGKNKERQRDQQRGIRQTGHLDNDHGNINAHTVKGEQGQRRDDDKQRRAKQRHEQGKISAENHGGETIRMGGRKICRQLPGDPPRRLRKNGKSSDRRPAGKRDSRPRKEWRAGRCRRTRLHCGQS